MGRWDADSFDWKDVVGVYQWVRRQLDQGRKVMIMYTGTDQYALTATDDIPAYLALIRMPGVDPVKDPMEIPQLFFDFTGNGDIPKWFFDQVNNPPGPKMAAEVGTDTASFYVIAPEQMWQIIEDQDWVAKAEKLWGGGPSGDVSKLTGDMAKIIRQHGGAYLTTGHDGPSEVGFTKKEKGQKEEGLMEPYGTPEFRKGKKAADRIAARWLRKQGGFAFSEVLSDRDLQQAIKNYVRLVIRGGQSLHHTFRENLQSALERIEGGDQVRTAEVLKDVERYLRKDGGWGQDKMTPLLARIIVNGDFVF